MIFLIIFFLMTGICYAETIQSNRGLIEVKNGETVKPNSLALGATIKGLENATFKQWNFTRPNPHTEVFINCKNLTFIDCNLNNVELQDDFTTKGSLTIHQREYEDEGKRYREIECGDNKIRTYEIVDTTIDIIERDFKDLKKEDKDKIKTKLEEQGISTMEGGEVLELRTTEDTPDEKKYKHIRIDPNTGLPK